MFQYCISIHFKWGLEIFFQRKTGGRELDGAASRELTARNITGRCDSDCNPAAGLQALTRSNCFGTIHTTNDCRTAKTSGQQASCSGPEAKGRPSHLFPASLGHRQYQLTTEEKAAVGVKLYCSHIYPPHTVQSLHSPCQLLASKRAVGKEKLFQPGKYYTS